MMQDYENDALNNLKKILINKWDFVTMQAEEQVKPLILPKPKPFRNIAKGTTDPRIDFILPR